MFSALTPDILDYLDDFQARLAAAPGDPRGAAVAVALDSTAAALSGWMAEADPTQRHDKQTLHAGFAAAAEICRAVAAKAVAAQQA
ncbi:hypothetical protein D0T25_24185 [Duganella sp. BJB488]|uniref:hypothetical protein n=1 Tax=unclassified Duganella TaxID=2636909 RepID=UPI000E342C1F|nr:MULTISPECIES: hypothetical protein [unclassified Duganella]RFP09355.1 hypothetical protein D0T23_27000 [Duganella sp. BJB475]RFP13243.1 hypothetical protein D0T26_23435 [Duganella sp. BJB489]RFP17182.1 hypothetical protein D0T25_24185 [Duganella sp. BJB488]RFP25391.1 hypothetical protein D0T21_28030 [Duganella sp. BJB476]RFP31598.1 hypothetical protein D0T24_24530 [Duganella sp. BJB480]